MGIIWDGIPSATPVIPAKAGIQSVGGAFPLVGGVDSRFRGNDYTWKRPRVAPTSHFMSATVEKPGQATDRTGRQRICACSWGAYIKDNIGVTRARDVSLILDRGFDHCQDGGRD